MLFILTLQRSAETICDQSLAKILKGDILSPGFSPQINIALFLIITKTFQASRFHSKACNSKKCKLQGKNLLFRNCFVFQAVSTTYSTCKVLAISKHKMDLKIQRRFSGCGYGEHNKTQ